MTLTSPPPTLLNDATTAALLDAAKAAITQRYGAPFLSILLRDRQPEIAATWAERQPVIIFELPPAPDLPTYQQLLHGVAFPFDVGHQPFLARIEITCRQSS